MPLIDSLRRRGTTGKRAVVSSGNLLGPSSRGSRLGDFRRLGGIAGSLDQFEITTGAGPVPGSYTVRVGPYAENGQRSRWRSLGVAAVLKQVGGVSDPGGPITCLGVKRPASDVQSAELGPFMVEADDRLWVAIETRDQSTLRYQLDIYYEDRGAEVDSGTLAITAQEVNLLVARRLVAEVGELSVAGQNATLTYVPAPSGDYWINLLGLDDPGFDFEVGTSVVTDSSDNIITLGQAYDSTTSSYKLVIAKFSNSGSILWQRFFDADNPAGIDVDTSDNIYICGHTNNAGAGSDDLVTAKFNSSGTIQWQRLLGGTLAERAPGTSSISVDGPGNAYVVGHTSSTGTTGGADALIAKYNTSGVLQWARRFGTFSTEQGFSVAVNSAGSSIYLAGYTAVGNVFSTQNFLILKYNSSGAIQWNRIFGKMVDLPYDEQAYSIAVDSSDNLYVSGRSTSEGAGSDDLILVKFNSSGIKQWVKLLGGAGVDLGWGVALDGLGSVYTVGRAVDVNVNALIAKYTTSDGTLQWQRKLGTAFQDEGFSITIDSAGAVCVVGYAAADSDVGDTDDMVIARLPADGSGTGTYGSLSYAVSSLTSTTGTAAYVDEDFTIATEENAIDPAGDPLTDTASSLTVSTSSLTPLLYTVV